MLRRKFLIALGLGVPASALGLTRKAEAAIEPKWTLINETEPHPLVGRGAEYLGAGYDSATGDPIVFIQVTAVGSPGGYREGVIQTWRIGRS